MAFGIEDTLATCANGVRSHGYVYLFIFSSLFPVWDKEYEGMTEYSKIKE